MENLIFTVFQHFLRNFRSLKWAKISISLLAIPACVFTFAFARADELPPGCIHPYDEPTHVRCTYTFTGSEQIFQVPAGVTFLDITAIGAAGAGDAYKSSGGKGGHANATISVTPGSTLYVEVGGAPTTDSSKCGTRVFCLGGWNGGGSSLGQDDNNRGMGDGGGGASDVRTVSASLPGSLDSRLIIGAGGGGGGGTFCNDIVCTDKGGNGGDAGSPGQNGSDVLLDALGGEGGGAGGLSAGGIGGLPGDRVPGEGQGGNGGSGQGGNGGTGFAGTGHLSAAGGGGGGYYGGGGGGAPKVTPIRTSGAGGGGGGSSFVSQGGITGVSWEPASVRIKYICLSECQE